MTKDSQEVRNGKPSRLTTGLLVGSMLFGLSSVSGCTARGTPAFLVDTYTRDIEKAEIERRRQYIRKLQMNSIPNHVYRDERGYHPIPGYDWVNPSDIKDLRVIPIK